jgi:hypothetical protein
VLGDLMRVEACRAALLKKAAAFAGDTRPLAVEEFDWATVVSDLRSDIDREARLRDVEVVWPDGLALRPAVADRQTVATAWACMVYAALEASTPGGRLVISLATPRIRPAILFTVSVQRAVATSVSPSPAAPADLLAGERGDLLIKAARHGAQRHGGRLGVTSTTEAVALEFVVPQPLAYWH